METLKRQLEVDEDRQSRQGRTPPHAVTPSAFIGNAIQIEGQQYVPYMALMNTSNLSF